MYTKEPDFTQLKKLWTLKTIVESGSLSRAATRSKVSVSAVSQCLTSLEKNLGRKLFIRKDRQLLPTSFCTDLLQTAEPAFKIFEEIDVLSSETCSVPKMSWLNFGISESLAGSVLPGFVRQVKAKLPNLRLTLKVGRCATLTKQVRSGQLCMALVGENDAMQGVSVYPLSEDRLGLYASNQLATNFRTAQALKNSEIATLIPDETGHPTYYSRFLRRLDRNFKPALASDSYESLYNIALSGSAAAVLPERLALRANGLLKEIPVGDDKGRNESSGRYKISMISEKVCDPAEDRFLISELKSLI